MIIWIVEDWWDQTKKYFCSFENAKKELILVEKRVVRERACYANRDEILALLDEIERDARDVASLTEKLARVPPMIVLAWGVGRGFGAVELYALETED